MLKYLASFYIIMLVMFLGCSENDEDLSVHEGPYIGIVLNKSSYTLKVTDPTDDDYYLTLKPNKYTKLGLKDTTYTFSFSYASDDKYYGSVTLRINSVNSDAEAASIICDWAVIVGEPGWFGADIDYYP